MPSIRRIARKLWPVEVEQTQCGFSLLGVQKSFFKGFKNHKNGQKQLFFKNKKKMPLRTPEEVLHAKFQTYSSKTVACGGGTDTNSK